LSAMVAVRLQADQLIVLSDIDGFYDQNPRENPAAKKLARVTELTPAMQKAAGGSGSNFGTGGMVTKLRAAQAMMTAGKQMVLCNGANTTVIFDVVAGKPVGTIFG